MAKLAELVKAYADSLGRDHGNVTLAARHLREAGLIASGGRGPGGAEMSPTDAANLLIGLLGSEQVKDSPMQVPHFRRSTLHYDLSRRDETIEENEDGSTQHTYKTTDLGDMVFLDERGALFGDIIQQLIEFSASGGFETYLAKLHLEARKIAGWDRVDDELLARRIVRSDSGFSIELMPYSFGARIVLLDYWSGHNNVAHDPLIDAGFVASDDARKHTSERRAASYCDEKLVRGCSGRTILAIGDALAGRKPVDD